MKKITSFVAFMCGVAFCLSACNLVSTDHQTANEKFRRQQNENKESLQKELTQYSGGQPGKISVNGTVVQNSQLDSRIHMIQKFGDSQRLSGNVVVLSQKNNNDEVASLRSISKSVSTEMIDKMTLDRSYIQIGCADVSSSWIAELKQAKADDASNVISANTVVICGAKTFASSKVTIVAHALYLKGATLEMRGSSGSLSITADKLYLMGTNKIESVGADATSNVLPAASIELNVLQGLFEDGTLKLSSTGGNCNLP